MINVIEDFALPDCALWSIKNNQLGILITYCISIWSSIFILPMSLFYFRYEKIEFLSPLTLTV